MIWQRFLKPCAAVVFVCGMTQGALAATSLSTPDTGWTVGPIAARSDSGISYCSMKNNFASGQMLVFARDGVGSNSIALDFHRNALQVGQQYPVTISAGAVKRRIIGLAATRQVLIMQTGTDTAFYNAVRHKGSIVFNLEKKDYGFNLNGSVSDALNALNDCADSFQSGGIFKSMTLPLGDAKPSDVASAVEETDEIAESAPAPAPAPKARTAQKASVKKPAAEPAPVSAMDLTLQADVEKLHAENQKLMNENQQTEMLIAARRAGVTTPVAIPQQPQSLQSNLTQLKVENAKMAQVARTEEAPQPLVAAAPVVASTPVVAPAPVAAPAPVVASAPVAAPAPVVASAPVAAPTSDSLKTLLEASQVVPQETLTQETPGSYSWKTEDMFGSAREMSSTPGKSLGDMANSYIQQASSQCKGSFAQKTGAVRQAGKLNVLESEMTCLDGQNEAAAAILFVEDHGKFNVITEEGTVDQLTAAMSDRDSIISAAAGQQVD
jgi:hypothetical protein